MRNIGSVSPAGSCARMQRSKGRSVTEVTISHLGRQGDGVAAGPIYVPRALPGEVVEGTVENEMIAAPRILTPSDQRVKPPCAHFKSCGGCQMQHASDDMVAEWKTGIVRAALAGQGIETDIRPIVTSPPQSRRRAKLAARRTKSGAIAGFHGRASHDVIDIRACTLTSPGLVDAPEIARALAVAGASRKGVLAVQITETLDGLDVSVSGGKPLDRELMQTLPALIERYGLARLTWDNELAGQVSSPRHAIGKARVALPPGAFLQATAHGEAALQVCVLEALGQTGLVADLFAGCGTFGLFLSDTRPVHAVEGSKEMIVALQEGANHSDAAHPVTSEVRDLFANPLLPEELARFEAVVLDPPRAGAAAQVAQIAKTQIPVIAYVSCDPGSFARDVAHLCAEGYRLDWVQPVDQFRWSAHVELAARLSLPHMTT